MPAPVAVAVPERLTDLPEVLNHSDGFAELLAALRRGRSGAIDGAWGSATALAVAALVHAARSPILVVLPRPSDLDGMADDLASFARLASVVFPSAEPNDLEGQGQRLRVLQSLRGAQPPRCVLAPLAALLCPVPARDELARRGRTLAVGQTLDGDEIGRWLIANGYKRVDAVEFPGDFSRRGGILDIYSPDAEAPYRLELFGDDIESMRSFSPQSQRSLGDLSEATILARSQLSSQGTLPPQERGHLVDYLPERAWVLLVEPSELREQGQLYLNRIGDPVGAFSVAGVFAELLKRPSVTITQLPQSSVEATAHLRVESVERFSGNVAKVRDELDAIGSGLTGRVLIACPTEAECHRLTEVLAASQLAQTDRLRLVHGRVHAGFRLVESGVVVLGSQELFHRDLPTLGTNGSVAPGRRVESRAIDSFLDLREGDLVVHVSQGIARYRGMHMLDRPSGSADATSAGTVGRESREEHLLLEFRDGVLVYVPVSKIDLVQKYVGGSKVEPELSKFGGTSWQRKKQRVEEAVQDLAAEMLDLQALRASQPGFAFPPDTPWQQEFEASFPYQETPDQLHSLAEIKADMERPRPMDRLLCGDVGYGKTELALRAAFKAIDNGRQVAVLVPTTVLAEQHFRTFRERLAEYPFVVECLSRLRSAAELRDILGRVAEGGVDVVIGTHRLISQDVRFKDIGLVIIDEEQRFGVEHKEKLKRLRAMVDVLTMTATPIPRTLHLALLGIRDISNLETPPPDRLAVETRIARFDGPMIRHAILRELNRDGQVFFVHNRVHTIQAIADRLGQIVPEARLVIAHGQMTPGELESAMVRFVRREADVLLATTIIESGLDIPNANTIFINQADQYGLADLHQLRGRVGRTKVRAYAYLLLDSDRAVTPNATRRLKAIEEFTELGAGFKIALRDLEIRGAGNILGTQQSGHIAAVGYELYCQLLENAVRAMKKQPPKTPLEVTVDLPWPAFLPRDYVPGQRLRIEVYRRLARLRDVKRLGDFRRELRDRYGPPPEPAEWLLRTAEIRILAARWKIASLHRDGPDLVLGYREERLAQRLVQRGTDNRLRIVDEKSLYYRLAPGEEEAETLFASLRHLLRSATDAADAN